MRRGHLRGTKSKRERQVERPTEKYSDEDSDIDGGESGERV